MSETLTHERLRRLLRYDPETGKLFWLVSSARRIKVGDEAGSRDARGRTQIKIEGRVYKAHRVIWFWMTGAWPCTFEIDHKNTDFADNRWINLRLATRVQNAANRRACANSKSGLKGVSVERRNRLRPWRSSIYRDGKNIFLGCFATKEEAHAAYAAAAFKHSGEFARAA